MKMMRIVLAGLTAVLVAGCEPTAEERAHVAASLPNGCRLLDLGSYGNIETLVVVVCNGKATATSHVSWSSQCGRNRCYHRAASVMVDD